MPGLDVNRGAKRAREARADFGLDPTAPLGDLLDVVEQVAGVPVVIARLPEGLAGACLPLARTRHLLFVDGAQPAVRQRFTLAHEFGHVRCGHDGYVVVDSFETVSGRTTDPHEVQANAFAAELLIPRAAVESVLEPEPSLEDVVRVAARFGTSALMTLYRFKQYGRISASTCVSLEEDIREQRHLEAYGRLGLAPVEDRLSGLASLPYVSPALENTLFGAVLRGDAEAPPPLAKAISRVLG